MKKVFICTFGSGQVLAGYYLKIIANSEEQAREFMFANFNHRWCTSHTEKEWLEISLKLGPFAEKEFKEIYIS